MRGLSLEQAAGLAGISKSYLSRLERGERTFDSRALLAHLAEVLEVSVTDLTGQPYSPRDREHAYAHRGVVGVRLALLDPDGPLPVGPAWPDLSGSPTDVAERLEQEAMGLWPLSRDCDLVGQSRAVPALLRQAHRHATASPSPAAYRAVALAAYDASFLMRNLGEPDLAWMAAEHMGRACAALDDPAWLALAAYTQAHALTPVGAWTRASTVATNTAQATLVPVGAAEQAAGRGACLLVGAYASACTGDVGVARAKLDEAEELAGWLGGGPSVVAQRTSFSDWNVIMHRVAVEIEAGDPALALKAAARLNPAGLVHRERLSYLWVDVGRAWARLDRQREAIAAFRRAEQATPLRVRLSPIVRESVRSLLDTAHRRATDTKLRGLAERCGVLNT